MERKRRLIYYLGYSACFMLLAGMILYFYYSQGKSMIDAKGDGFRQHFRALLYYSNYLKKIFSGIIHGSFEIPQWDFTIGEGSDILISLHYYCIGDIFTFFCFLVPEKYMFLYYDIATFARMFFAGIVFSNLCFFKKKNNCLIVMCGAILYAFCSLSLSNLGGHVFFLSATVYLPLIILGIEKIIDEDRPSLLSIAVMLSALSNILFFYMNVLSTVIYVTVRLLCIDSSWKERIGIFLKITLYSFIGVMMSAIVLLPMANVLFSNARLEAKIITDLFYPLSDYLYFLTSISFNGYKHFGGFSVLGITAMLWFLINNKSKTLNILLIISVVFNCLPFFGKLYNAMVYPTDRWLYAVSLLLAYMTVDAFDCMDEINISHAQLPILLIAYYLLCIILDKEQWKIHALFLAIAVFLILSIRFVKNRKLCSLLCLGIVVFSLALNILYLYSPLFYYGAEGGKSVSEITEMDNTDEHSIFSYINDDSYYRYSGNNNTTNESIQGPVSSTQYYWSVVNDYVVKFRKQLGFTDNSNHHYANYDDRFVINALAGVRYYINKNSMTLPYGFDFFGEINGYEVYKSGYDLPPLFVYDSYLLSDDYLKYDLEEKNEILVQTVVVDKDIEGLDKAGLYLDDIDIAYRKQISDGIKMTDKKITVEDRNGKIILDVKNNTEGEYYVAFEGLNSDETVYISIAYKDVNKAISFKGRRNLHFSDRHDYLVNLGYLKGIEGEIMIGFSGECEFDYSSMKVICQPLEHQIECLEKRKDLKILNYETGINNVYADIDIQNNGMVCFSIPYSKGWKVYVDGTERELINCNLQYMGVYLEKGTHTIKLKYCTPFIKAGSLLSCSGIVLLTTLAYVNKRKKIS